MARGCSLVKKIGVLDNCSDSVAAALAEICPSLIAVLCASLVGFFLTLNCQMTSFDNTFSCLHFQKRKSLTGLLSHKLGLQSNWGLVFEDSAALRYRYN